MRGHDAQQVPGVLDAAEAFWQDPRLRQTFKTFVVSSNVRITHSANADKSVGSPGPTSQAARGTGRRHVRMGLPRAALHAAALSQASREMPSVRV